MSPKSECARQITTAPAPLERRRDALNEDNRLLNAHFEDLFGIYDLQSFRGEAYKYGRLPVAEISLALLQLREFKAASVSDVAGTGGCHA